jgi:hypothetical protein
VTERGNKYILVIADYFSKWTECFPMRNMGTGTLARIIVEKVITRFGVPYIIHFDQGTQNENHEKIKFSSSSWFGPNMTFNLDPGNLM